MAGPARFDGIIHAPNRLQVCALLAAVEDADFSMLRDTLGLSDSVLSKHLKVLAGAGYVKTRSATFETRARKKVALTGAGRRAYAAHVEELKRLISGG